MVAAILFINGVKSLESKTFRGEPITQFVDLSAGKYEVRVQLLDDSGFGTIFNTNPTGFSLRIIKDVVKVISTPPWTTNPLCASAIIIPPPCPKVIEGTGVVTDIIAEEPGNGYPTPPGGGPPVTLVLKDVIPTSPGINYGPEDLIFINGNPLKPILGPFGTVEGVEPSDRPYYGITEYPNITMPSDTGVGFRGRPVFEPVIVPETCNTRRSTPSGHRFGWTQTNWICKWKTILWFYILSGGNPLCWRLRDHRRPYSGLCNSSREC